MPDDDYTLPDDVATYLANVLAVANGIDAMLALDIAFDAEHIRLELVEALRADLPKFLTEQPPDA